jgi:hypothetical protein
MGQVSPQGNQIGPEDGPGSLNIEQQIMHQSDHASISRAIRPIFKLELICLRTSHAICITNINNNTKK